MALITSGISIWETTSKLLSGMESNSTATVTRRSSVCVRYPAVPPARGPKLLRSSSAARHPAPPLRPHAPGPDPAPPPLSEVRPGPALLVLFFSPAVQTAPPLRSARWLRTASSVRRPPAPGSLRLHPPAPPRPPSDTPACRRGSSHIRRVDTRLLPASKYPQLRNPDR